MYLKAMSMFSSWTKTSQRDMMAFPRRPTSQLKKLWRLYRLVIARRLSTRTAVSKKKNFGFLKYVPIYLFIFFYHLSSHRTVTVVLFFQVELRKHSCWENIFYLIYLRTFGFSRRLCFDSFWRAPRHILVSFGTGSRFRPTRCHATHDY